MTDLQETKMKPVTDTLEHEYIQAALSGVLSNLAAGLLTQQIDGMTIISIAVSSGRAAYKMATSGDKPRINVIVPTPGQIVNPNSNGRPNG